MFFRQFVLTSLGHASYLVGDPASGEEVQLGGLILRLLHLPGHTPEHAGLLVTEERADHPGLLLSGGALLVGSVGRPDLLGGPERARAGALALHETLPQRLAGLPDALPVYPTHLAGSLCGAGIDDARSTTLGRERRVNAAFATADPWRFVADLLHPDHLPAVPPHWRRMRPQNLAGPPSIGPAAAPTPLAPAAFAAAGLGVAVVLDVRDPQAFAAGHVPGSLNVPLEGAFPTWAGTVLSEHARTVLVSGTRADAEEAALGLLRVGLAAPAGVLAGGMAAWEAAGHPVATVARLDVQALRRRAGAGEVEPLDVRQPGEWAGGHLAGARLLTAAEVPARLGELSRVRTWVVLCEGGYRSSVVASLLQRDGFAAATLAGGMSAWRAAGLPVVARATPLPGPGPAA
jgi:hydroxyacylglutathione hydrolase